MKHFFKGIFYAFIIYFLVFFAAIGLSQFLSTASGLPQWLNGVQLYLSAVSWTGYSLAALLAAAAVFFFNVFSKSSLARFLFILAAAAVLSSWMYIRLPDLSLQVRETLKEQALEKARKEAAANLMYQGASVFEYEGLPVIQVVSSQGVSQQWVDNIVYNAMYKLPSFLLEKCSTIVFMDEDAFAAENKDSHLSNVVGLANSGDMSIKVLIQDMEGQYIDTSMPEFVMDPIDYYLNTIMHELGHLYDYQYAYNQEFISDDPVFARLYSQHGSTLNDYASSSQRELFAEGVKLYILYPQYLLNKSEAVYTYFEQLFNDSIPH